MGKGWAERLGIQRSAAADERSESGGGQREEGMPHTDIVASIDANAAALHPLPPKHLLTETYLRMKRLAMLF